MITSYPRQNLKTGIYSHTALPAVVCCALLCLITLIIPAQAQIGEAYVNITGFEAKEYNNAVVVILQADGDFDFHMDDLAWLNDGSATRDDDGDIDFDIPGHRFSWWIPDARSKLSSDLVLIGKYPVSHFEIKPGAPPDQTWFDGEYALRITFETYSDMWPWWSQDEKGYMTWWDSDDNRSVYIAFLSDRQLDLPAPQSEDDFALTAPTEFKISEAKGRFSISALNVSLQDFAQSLSRTSGSTVSADPASSRRITLNLQNQTLSELLDSLGRACGLSILPLADGYYLCEADAASFYGYMQQTTLSRPLRFLKAREARRLLPNFLLPYLRVEERKNILHITAPRPLLQRVAAELDLIDQPAPHILVETIAVEFTSRQSAEQALRLRFFAPGAGLEISTQSGDLNFFDLGGSLDDFRADLQALFADSQALLRSESSAVVLNGETAEIFVGQTRPVVLESESSGRLEEIKIGAGLSITPTTDGGEFINLSLKPEVNTLLAVDPAKGLPVISVRRAKSKLRLKSGDTVALAGLHSTQTSSLRRKIPLLGDAPLVGELFQSHQNNRRNTEMIIFITAKNISPQEAGSLAVHSGGL